MNNDPKVFPLRAGAPLLTDILDQLRGMAKLIEDGELTGTSAMFILLDDDAEEGDWPKIFGWGEQMGVYRIIGVLEICKAWFSINKTKRFS